MKRRSLNIQNIEQNITPSYEVQMLQARITSEGIVKCPGVTSRPALLLGPPESLLGLAKLTTSARMHLLAPASPSSPEHLPNTPLETPSQRYEARIEEGKLYYDKRW